MGKSAKLLKAEMLHWWIVAANLRQIKTWTAHCLFSQCKQSVPARRAAKSRDH